jgi:hypothetical protein
MHRGQCNWLHLDELHTRRRVSGMCHRAERPPTVARRSTETDRLVLTFRRPHRPTAGEYRSQPVADQDPSPSRTCPSKGILLTDLYALPTRRGGWCDLVVSASSHGGLSPSGSEERSAFSTAAATSRGPGRSAGSGCLRSAPRPAWQGSWSPSHANDRQLDTYSKASASKGSSVRQQRHRTPARDGPPPRVKRATGRRRQLVETGTPQVQHS